MKITGIQVVIMCKAPVAGRVKTRLMAAFSAQKAADLHAAMATTVIHRAMRLFEDVVVAADDPGHPFFTRFDLPVTAQGEGDLGDRMLSQVVRAFEDGGSMVMLLGTDSPHMPDAKLLEASALLQDHSVVIGPVEDGGYELIGLSSPHPLFSGIAWSTDRVLAQTMALVRAQHLSCKLPETGFDIDNPEDLNRVNWPVY